MDLLVAILVVAAIIGAAFYIMQRRPIAMRDLGPRPTPAVSKPRRRARRGDPMTDAVVEHARVTDPRDVPAAEGRLRAQARQVAGELQADAWVPADPRHDPSHDLER